MGSPPAGPNANSSGIVNTNSSKGAQLDSQEKKAREDAVKTCWFMEMLLLLPDCTSQKFRQRNHDRLFGVNSQGKKLNITKIKPLPLRNP